MKKIVIVFVILLLLLSTMGYVNSRPINLNKSNDDLNLDDNIIQNIDQDIEIQIETNDINPKPIQSRSLADSPWPMFRQNLNHTGRSIYDTSSNPGKLVWSYITPYNLSWNMQSSVAIDNNGTLYFGSNDRHIYAIFPNGTEKWSFYTWDEVHSSPAIDSNGIIYVGTTGGVFAINPDGTKKWSLMLGQMESSPIIGPNNMIYIGSNANKKLYAIYPNGTINWSFIAGDSLWSSPAIGSNGTIYVGSWDNNLYSINPNGTKNWNFTAGDSIFSSPAIGPDGTIYIGSLDNRIYAINPNGTEKWNVWTWDDVWSSPAIGSDGTVYIGSRDDSLYAINPDGTKKWSFYTGGKVNSSPAISSDGTIYIGSMSGKLYAINPNGNEKWHFSSVDLSGIDSSPSIGSDGTIYFASQKNNLFAIGEIPLYLSNNNVTPSLGYTNNYFNYSVNYHHKFDKTPIYINITINNINYTMKENEKSDKNFTDGKNYYLNISNLNIGINTYQFWTSDGINAISTEIFYNPFLYNTCPKITIQNNLTAIEDIYYEVVYQYDDVDRENVAQFGAWDFSSNATWLSFNTATAMLYGTPSNDDVGSYWVNISINDTMDMDFTNFALTVINENDDPLIETVDIEITYEDELYEVNYNATDVDSLISNQIWSLDTNASSWLDLDSAMGIINGTPTNDEVGEYWVNVSLADGDGGGGYTNFTLTVLNVNDPPVITTQDVFNSNESELYQVDYNATDVDNLQTQQTWTIVTNATWLSIDPSTGVLSGTPVFKNLFADPGIIVAWWNVNVIVNDGDGGSDRHEFMLFVFKDQELINEPPLITTTDVLSTTVDELYYVDYDAIDDRTPSFQLTWKLNTDAGWLDLESETGVLSGTPSQSGVGAYWVNVSVLDTDGGVGSHNFTLTVYSESNEPPDILTEDDINAVVDELYSVDYEAEDDHTPLDKLVWSLETNTSDWLDIDPVTGVLSGTPKLDDVGSYWVKVSVFDGEDGWDHANFTLWVTTVAITEYPPQLSNPSMTPTTGDTNTEFTFSVDYSHTDGDLPDSIEVVIDGIGHDMTSTNGHYEYKTKLPEGNHTYYFTTKLGDFRVNTDTYNTGHITKAEDPPEDGDGDGEEDNTMLYALLGIIVIIVVVLILLFIFLKKKKAKEEPTVEEVQPPSPEEVPPEVPPEQMPTPETPPTEQPPIAEAPPEQVPVPVPPPPEQPQIQPEQPLPTPEVTAQVPQPQVAPSPGPAPMPQVEEQPTPQVEQSPQVEAQEPQGQAPVPKIKTPED